MFHHWRMHAMLLFLILMCITTYLKAEIYTSVHHVSNAFRFERKMADALSRYLEKTEQKIQRIKRYLNDYQQVEQESKMLKQIDFSTEKSVSDVEETLAANPLQVFQLMKRLTVDWKHLLDTDPVSDWREIEDIVHSEDRFNMSVFSNEEELMGTAKGIILLQSIYQLNTTSLASGNIDGIQTAAELKAQDCLYLGKHSFNLGMYLNAVMWFEQAYTLAGLEMNETITQDQVLQFLDKAYNKVAESEEENESSVIVSSKMSHIKLKKNASRRKVNLGEYISAEDSFKNYEALCRGEQLLSDKYVAQLKCFYSRRNSSYLTLMPAKVERKHIDPEILVFHDVITYQTIQNIKSFADPVLSRGLVQGDGVNHESTTSQVRISKTAWLDHYTERSEFKHMLILTEALTGLSIEPYYSSENLQISNYGIGGHYSPHFDFFKMEDVNAIEKEAGDRTATLMYYMSNVNKGGATAFPNLGVSLFPEMGSAVFWHNLKKSGVGNRATLHGGCPVVHGSKWVANKWIRDKNQVFRRPCGLTEEE